MKIALDVYCVYAGSEAVMAVSARLRWADAT